ncbi:ankyrin repeat-containing domain protein, partial [Pavlovales sp. CCMP2436]
SVNGMSLLHFAAQNGHLEACQLLVQSGPARVDIEQQDREGRTALHWACLGAHVAVGRYLESVGASTDTQDQFGRTAL